MYSLSTFIHELVFTEHAGHEKKQTIARSRTKYCIIMIIVTPGCSTSLAPMWEGGGGGGICKVVHMARSTLLPSL